MMNVPQKDIEEIKSSKLQILNIFQNDECSSKKYMYKRESKFAR